MKRRLIKAVAVILLSLTMATGVSVSAGAKTIVEIIMEEIKENSREIENVSTLSSDKIMLGEPVSMNGAVKGIEAEKCTFGFYVRVKGMVWMTLQSYSSKSVCEWTPSVQGDYEICIKVKYKTRIFKQYYDLRVTEELHNRSYMSTSFVQQGGMVELAGNAEGGFGKLLYGFFYKGADSEKWTALSDYSEACNIRWKPAAVGDYDICIKVKDQDEQLEKKYFRLTVSPVLLKTPCGFSVTVKSPISSPYFWQYSVEDEGVVQAAVTESAPQLDEVRAYVYREYQFTTQSAGRTVIHLNYDTHSGRKYTLRYDITVDKNLNYKINDVSGSYFDGELPQAEQHTGSFGIKVANEEGAGRWRCEISDSLVAEEAQGSYGEEDAGSFRFNVYREGYVTLILSCSGVSRVQDRYKLIYNLYVDKNLKVTLRDSDGYYLEGEALPELTE